MEVAPAVSKPPDESNIGIWLWVILIVQTNVEWILMDLWLDRHGHEFLTTEVREALRSPAWAAVVTFLIGGTISAFCYHMLVQK